MILIVSTLYSLGKCVNAISPTRVDWEGYVELARRQPMRILTETSWPSVVFLERRVDLGINASLRLDGKSEVIRLHPGTLASCPTRRANWCNERCVDCPVCLLDPHISYIHDFLSISIIPQIFDNSTISTNTLISSIQTEFSGYFSGYYVNNKVAH